MAADRELRQAREPDTWDRRLACVAGLTVFGVYLATIYPGLTDIGDATKFSFVGKILGTPHPPGYPLYVMVSHLFSYVPIGNLAYRMNVFSALWGAVTVGVAYLMIRRLGVSRAPAVGAAIALGLGHAFWSRALYAKTYTLHTALVATGMLLLLKWDDSRRYRDFCLAVVVFCLGLGNHLTIIALIPALVVFPLMTEPRTILRARTIAFVIAAALAGLAQYLFILIRTRQGGPIYLEARARTLSELWSVMTASRFSHEVGAYSVASLVHERIPLIAGLVFREVGAFGLVLLAVGFSVLWIRRTRVAVLLGLGGLSVTWLTTNMSSEEDQGFLLAAFVLFWAMIAVGLQWTIDAVRRMDLRLAAALAFGLAIALPAVQVTANYRVNDHHRETFETEYINTVFAGLPPRVAFVQDEYRVNMILNYKFHGEQAVDGRDIRLISRNRAEVNQFHRDGFTVLAFRAGRDALAPAGFNVVPYVIPATGPAQEVLNRREIFRVLAMPECDEIGNLGWRDVSRIARPKGRLSVRFDNYRPFESRLVVYSGGDHVPVPMVAGTQGAGRPRVEVETFPAGDADAKSRLSARVAADRATLPDALLESRTIARTEVRVNDNGEFSIVGLDFGLGTTAVAGAAWVDQDEPRRAAICSHALADADALPLGQPRRTIAFDATDVQFGDDWNTIERRPDGMSWRWTTHRASLLVPIDEPRAIRVTVEAEPFTSPKASASSMTLLVNGQAGESRPLERQRSRMSWTVPADRLRAGLNEFVLQVAGATRPVDVGVSPDDRLLGASVTAIELGDVALMPADPGQAR